MNRMATPAARPTVMATAVRIFDLSLGQMLWSRRSVFLALIAAAPVGLAALIRFATFAEPRLLPQINGERLNGAALFGLMIWLLYVRFIVPVLGMFYGTSLVADEVDDKTITYLFVRPIPRGAVLIGKYLAYFVCTALLILPSVVLVYFLLVPIGGGSIGRSFPSLAIDLGMLAAGIASYGALFAWVGARLKRPLVIGLVFVFGWEPGVLLFPGYLKRATIAYYLQGLVPHTMPQESTVSILLQVFQEAPPVPLSLAALAGVTLIGVWLAARATETREYVLEQ
jgi:ABC-type transport system involved in multi-copper enzyme maturation permease subunit